MTEDAWSSFLDNPIRQSVCIIRSACHRVKGHWSVPSSPSRSANSSNPVCPRRLRSFRYSRLKQPENAYPLFARIIHHVNRRSERLPVPCGTFENANDSLGDALGRNLIQLPWRYRPACALFLPHVTLPDVNPPVCHVGVELEIGVEILARRPNDLSLERHPENQPRPMRCR